MYEDKTYEAILQEKLARVASSLDKREGSIIFDALAPNSLESAMIYVALDTVLNETFADTASRDYLIMRCAERGITPLPATCAVGIGEFSMDIPVGTRFSCDKYNWAVTSITLLVRPPVRTRTATPASLFPSSISRDSRPRS